MSENLVSTDAPADGSKKDPDNLRAIREILSYILVDAVQDGYQEVAERIDFAMLAAEKILKQQSVAAPTVVAPAPPDDIPVATDSNAPAQDDQKADQG